MTEQTERLLATMTIDEKVAQLGGVGGQAILDDGRFSPARAAEQMPHGIGHISRIASSTSLGLDELGAVASSIQAWLRTETRLGLPAIVHEESTAGFCARGATCFPQAIGLAATWDPELIGAMAEIIREEMRAAGAHQTLAPVLDIARDPRWGRVEETYGEDPYLVSRLGVAYVHGLQGSDWAQGIVATGKHFLGYGASEGGLNWAPAHIPPRELREVYAAPFRAAIVEAGLGSMMNSYAEIDGDPCGGSTAVLTSLLRDELGFDGVVVADYFTVMCLLTYHRVANSPLEAAVRALTAGLDVELPNFDCYRQLPAAVAQGVIDEELVDRSVRRVLDMKARLGLLAAGPAPSLVAFERTGAAADVAVRLAEESLVLLKNDGGLLPLSPSVGRMAVVGPAADSRRLLQGDYHYPAHIEMLFGDLDLSDHFPEMVTLVDGIRARVPAAEVVSAPGCDVMGEPDPVAFDAAVAAAGEAEVAIVCVGGRSGLVEGSTSGESVDAADLGLPGAQPALVEAVVATGVPTIVVVVSGRAHALSWMAENVPAVLYAWLPGQAAGTAVARVLFGDADPSGRLPITLPRSAGHLPSYHGHKPSGGRSQWKGDYYDAPVAPLWRFGHGLSYTTFAYDGLWLPPSADAIEVSVSVTNTGDRPGIEVVQLYLHDRVASLTRPVRQLAGFSRVPLDPSESARVGFSVDPGQLAFYDQDMRFVVEPGDIDVAVGGLTARFVLDGDLDGDVRDVDPNAVRPTTVTVD